ncbi:unnamed protein product [Lactuca virosa]|uniref:Clathrin light chain n=1 Tax=Lactuca virosa TaxID=75947 RepID=A0AAU9PLD3_9ASTR|nr:unnamed protein product [Lactuca virosa]
MKWEDVEIGEPEDMRNSNEKESHQSKTSLMFISVKTSAKQLQYGDGGSGNNWRSRTNRPARVGVSEILSHLSLSPWKHTLKNRYSLQKKNALGYTIDSTGIYQMVTEQSQSVLEKERKAETELARKAEAGISKEEETRYSSMEMHHQNKIKRYEEREAEIAKWREYYCSEEGMEAEKAKWRKIYYSTLKEKEKEKELPPPTLSPTQPTPPTSPPPLAPPSPPHPPSPTPLEFKNRKDGAVWDIGGSNQLVRKLEAPLIDGYKPPLPPPPPSPSPPPSTLLPPPPLGSKTAARRRF